MKRTLWIILALALLFTLCCGAAVADGDVTRYDLRLGYIQVTSANQDDILGDGGKAKYDPVTNTLTLDNPEIEWHGDMWLIRTGITRMTIAGTWTPGPSYSGAKMILSDNEFIQFDGTFIFDGPRIGLDVGYMVMRSGILEVTNATDTPIKASRLTVEDTISRIKLSASDEKSALQDVRSLVLGEAVRLTPSSYARCVLMEPASELSDLWLGSAKVTLDNYQDIFGDGSASLDLITYTLTLNDPVIPGVYTDSSGLSAKIYSAHDLSVRGSYHMDSAGGSQFGIYTTDYLTLEGDFRFAGTQAGVSASGLIMKENSVMVEMQGGQAGLMLAGNHCDFEGTQGPSLPVNAEIRESSGRWVYIEENGNTASTVRIQPGYRAYPVWLGSVRVNRHNCQDILGDGKASYDPATHLLTLNDPVIQGMHTDASGVTAKIYAGESLTVEGSYHMSAAGGSQFGIFSSDRLTLEGDFRFMGTQAGVSASGLTVKENSVMVEMQGGQAGLMLAGNRCDFEGTQGPSLPVNAEIRESGGRWVYIDVNGNTASTVRIQPGYRAYPVWLGSVRVNGYNCQDILGDGKASYDPAARLLTLNGPVIQGMHTDASGVTAKIYAGESLTVEGNYHMNAADGSQFGIFASDRLTLEGDFRFIGTQAGVSASGLTVKENSVMVDMQGGQAGLTLAGDQCDFEGTQGLSLPVNAEIRESGGRWVYIDVNGNTASTVRIQPGYRAYPVWLGSVRVNGHNCQDILGDGKASYDPAARLLTLNDPVIQGMHTDASGVSANIYAGENLTVEGSYHMNAAGGSQFGIYTSDYLTLEGDFRFMGTQAGVSAFGLTVKEYSVMVDMQGGQAGLTLGGDLYIFEGTQGASLPLFAQISEINGRWGFADDSGAAARRAVIQPGYSSGEFGIWVGSTRVTVQNYGNIFGDGKASYDPLTHMLTLQNGVNIQGIHTNGNSYTSKIYAVDTPLSITGSYTMNEAEAQFGVMVENGTLNLSGSLTFRGTVDGAFAGIYPSDEPDLFRIGRHDDVKLTGNITLIGGRCGLKAEGTAELNGNITLNGSSIGLSAGRKLTISGGNISIVGQRGGFIDAGGFEMTGGKAAVTASQYMGLEVHGNFTISGGEITVTSNGGLAGITVNTDVYINGGSVTAVSLGSGSLSRGLVSTGIIHVSGGAQRIVLDGKVAGLEAEGLVISNTGSQNLQIVEPADGFYYKEAKSILEYTSSTTAQKAKHVVFDHAYKLWLGDTVVFRGNQDDIFGDGKASFNPDTNVLTLNNPDIAGDITDMDRNKMKIVADGIPLTIRGSYSMPSSDVDIGLAVLNAPLTLDGSFYFTAEVDGIIAGEGLTVSGGIVHARGSGTAGVLVLNGDLTLSGGSFSATSDNRGVNVNRGKLIIGPGIDTAFFQGVGYAAIVAQEGIILPESGTSQVKLVFPGNGYIRDQTVFDPSLVPLDAGPVFVPLSSGGDYPAHSVYFESERLYGLALGSVIVTSSNASDILGDGTASYDPLTQTLTLDEPVISGNAVDSSNGFAATNTIIANNIDRLTIKGKWHMSYPKDDYAIRVSKGSLVLDGSFSVGGAIAGVSARDEIVVQSGRLYALGGEIGAVGSRLVIGDGCGYVELVSGSGYPGLFESYPVYPNGYQFTDTDISFQPGRTINTTHYEMDEVVLIMKYDRSVFRFVPTTNAKFTDITGFEGAGSENDPYQIKTAEHWNRLAQQVENGRDLSHKHFGLMNDLTVTTMIGSSAHPFSGTFDGGGHTLTFNATAGGNYCAPFRYVGTAVIKNLRTAGTISTGSKFAAGIVGDAAGSCRIVNCVSDVDIVSSVSGDGTHGGLVAVGSNVTIVGSLFTGSITGANTTLCAGFLGWDRGGSSVSWCVYNGTMSTKSDSSTFIRNADEAPNCYYFRPIGQGRDKGKAAHSVSASGGISLDFGGGMPYSVSGITAYSAGIRLDNSFYAGAGDRVSMRIVYGDAPMGTRFNGVAASGGELTEGEEGVLSLMMQDSDVTVYPLFVPEYGSGTEGDPWLINSAVFPITDLPAGWYRALGDRFPATPVTVNGETHLMLAEGRTLSVPGGIIIGPDGSLAISGTGTLNVTGKDGGPAIGGSGTITFADGLKVTAGGEQTPADAADRAAACAASSVTIGACDHEGGAVIAHGGAGFCAYCNAALSFTGIGSGTADDPYRISTAEIWNLFVHSVEHGFSTQGKHFLLTDHISVTEMMGTWNNKFAGTFDGNGKTLTFHADNTDNDTSVAPFAWTSGATIRSLHVTGAITGSRGRAAGLIGENKEAVTQVINCRVSMTLSGSYYIGGFCVGEEPGIRFTGCVFDGSITSTDKGGGFAGWSDQSSGLRFTDCVFAPKNVSFTNNCGTFFHDTYNSGTQVMINCYYLTAAGIAQGKQAYPVNGGKGVTIDFGTPETTYGVSGIRVYQAGIQYGGVFYAGEGESVAMSLSADPWQGHDTTFAASAGMLKKAGAGWNLTMPSGEVKINAQHTPTFATAPAISLDYMSTNSGGYGNEYPSQMFDDRNDTKWCCPFSGTSWVEFRSYVPIRVTAYSMTTGGDTQTCPGRNPVSWKLLGRMSEGDSWIILAEETDNDHLPPENCAQVFFPLASAPACQLYRLEITAIEDGNTMQLAGFSLIGTPVFGTAAFALPTGLRKIEESAFEGLTAMTVVDAGHCTSVGKWAFKGCTGLTELKLPKNCTIDPDAFTGCGTVYIFAPAGGKTEAYCNAHENCVFAAE